MTESKRQNVREAIIDFRKCAFTGGKMRIYRSYLPYMHIFPSVYAHIRKEKCAYMETRFHKCTSCLMYMCIYGRELL